MAQTDAAAWAIQPCLCGKQRPGEAKAFVGRENFTLRFGHAHKLTWAAACAAANAYGSGDG